jgi:multiple sugar transport system substrate-binding protein
MTLVVLIGILLCACGGAATPSGRVSFMIFGDPAEKAAYEQLVSEFQQRNPAISVDLVHIPSQGDYRQRLGSDLAAGTPADIVLINYRRYAPYAEKDALEPLGPYLAKSTLIAEQDFYPQAIEPFRWKGTVMCIPQNLSSLVVYYNRDLFKAANIAEPSDTWTWADFLSAAKALTKDTNGDGVTDQYGLGSEVSIFRIAPFIWQNGGSLVDNEQIPTRLAVDTPAAREAIQWFVDLQVKHKVTPDATAESAESSEQRFLNGSLGMFLNSRRGTPTYRAIQSFDWDIAPLPHNQQAATILHADAYCLPKASKNKDAAWKLIEFANSPEGQAIIARSGRTVPSLRSVAESDVFLDPQAKPSRSRIFLDAIDQIRAVPVIPSWVEIEDISGEEFERAFYGQATVDEVITTLIDRTTSLFEQ